MKFQIFTRRGLRGRRWYFRLRANNGEPVCQSEAYNSERAARGGIEAVRKATEYTPIEVLD